MMIYITLGAVVLALLTHLFFTVLKRIRSRALHGVFRYFNENGQDINVLCTWIEDRNSALRLLDTLEYLIKIDEHDIARQLYLALPFDAWPVRAIRVLAVKLLRVQGLPEANLLVDRLFEAYPGDDSILEIYIDTKLDLGHNDQAEAALMPRLQRSVKGTVFSRQKARLLAAQGKRDEALAILEKVVEQDHRHFKNTVAPTQKHLLYEQSEVSRKLLEQLKGKDKS